MKKWVFKGEEKQPQLKMGLSQKKNLFAVFFRSNGLVKAVKLEGQKTVTSNWYTTVCLPKIFDEIFIKGAILARSLTPLIFHGILRGTIKASVKQSKSTVLANRKVIAK